VAIGALIPWDRETKSNPPVQAQPAPPPKPAPAAIVAAAKPSAQPSEMDEDEEEEIELYAQAALEWPPSHLSPGQVRRLNTYPTSGQKLLGERLAATVELLTHADNDRYSLELYTTDKSDPARVERFLTRARDLVPLDEMFVIPLAAADGAWRVRVVLGDYESREDALDAARRLPPKYQRAFQPLPRTFAELRQAL